LFVDEMLVEEGDLRLWVPVQKTLAADIKSLVPPGSSFTAFVGYLGAVVDARVADWVFILNAFDK
jgi:hypothetical protein